MQQKLTHPLVKRPVQKAHSRKTLHRSKKGQIPLDVAGGIKRSLRPASIRCSKKRENSPVNFQCVGQPALQYRLIDPFTSFQGYGAFGHVSRNAPHMAVGWIFGVVGGTQALFALQGILEYGLFHQIPLRFIEQLPDKVIHSRHASAAAKSDFIVPGVIHSTRSRRIPSANDQQQLPRLFAGLFVLQKCISQRTGHHIPVAVGTEKAEVFPIGQGFLIPVIGGRRRQRPLQGQRDVAPKGFDLRPFRPQDFRNVLLIEQMTRMAIRDTVPHHLGTGSQELHCLRTQVKIPPLACPSIGEYPPAIPPGRQQKIWHGIVLGS